jgi:formate hydrogenlyase subunit 6/NADH:ubiquinone oxidoreductase subunit I
MYCYDIDILPKCKVCNNSVKLIDFTNGFREYCSKGCISRDSDIKKLKLKNKTLLTDEEKLERKNRWYQENKDKVKQQKLKNKERDRQYKKV